MPIVFKCPGCSVPLKMADSLVGKNIKCPKCSKIAKVPASAGKASSSKTSNRTLPNSASANPKSPSKSSPGPHATTSNASSGNGGSSSTPKPVAKKTKLPLNDDLRASHAQDNDAASSDPVQADSRGKDARKGKPKTAGSQVSPPRLPDADDLDGADLDSVDEKPISRKRGTRGKGTPKGSRVGMYLILGLTGGVIAAGLAGVYFFVEGPWNANSPVARNDNEVRGQNQQPPTKNKDPKNTTPADKKIDSPDLPKNELPNNNPNGKNPRDVDKKKPAENPPGPGPDAKKPDDPPPVTTVKQRSAERSAKFPFGPPPKIAVTPKLLARMAELIDGLKDSEPSKREQSCANLMKYADVLPKDLQSKLAALLDDPNLESQNNAAAILAMCAPDAKYVPIFKKALAQPRHSMLRVARVGVAHLGKLGAPLIDDILDQMEKASGGQSNTAEAVNALRGIGPVALPQVKKRIELAMGKNVRNPWLAYALGAMGEAAIPSIVDLLNLEEDTADWYAGNALNSIKKSSLDSLPMMQRMARSENYRTRRLAFSYITRLDPNNEVNELLWEGLRSSDNVVVMHCFERLRQQDIPAEKWLPVLRDVIKPSFANPASSQMLYLLCKLDPEAGKKAVVAEMTGWRHLSENALPVLLSVAKDQIPPVVPNLANSLKVSRPNDRKSILRLLSELPGDALKPAEEELTKALAKEKGIPLFHAAKALLKIDPDNQKAIAALGSFLSVGSGTYPTLQVNDVLDVVLKLGPKARAALPGMRLAFTSNNTHLKARVLMTMARIDPGCYSEVSSAAKTMLEDKNEANRLRGACVLFDLNPNDDKARDIVRMGIATGGYLTLDLLEAMGPKAKVFLPELEELANNPEYSFPAAAATTLGLISGDSDTALARLLHVARTNPLRFDSALRGMGRFGAAARPVLPILLTELLDKLTLRTPENVDSLARIHPLAELDPAAALASVKDAPTTIALPSYPVLAKLTTSGPAANPNTKDPANKEPGTKVAVVAPKFEPQPVQLPTSVTPINLPRASELPEYALQTIGSVPFRFNCQLVRYAPSGRLLAVGAGNAVVLVDAVTGTELARYDHLTFISTAKTKLPRLGGRPVQPSQPKSGYIAHKMVRHIQFTNDGRNLLTADEAGAIRLWNVRDGSEKEFPIRIEKLVKIMLSDDDRSYFTIDEEGRLDQWELKEGGRIASWKTPGKHKLIDIGFQQGKVIVVNELGSVFFWDAAQRKETGKIEIGPVQLKGDATYPRVAISSDGSWLVQRNGMQVWDLRTGRMASRLDVAEFRFNPPTNVQIRFTPDNRFIIVQGWEKQPLTFYDPRTGKKAFEFENSPRMSLDFVCSPDGRLLVNLHSQGLEFFDFTTGQRIHNADGIGTVLSWRVSDDASRLLVGTREKGIQLFDLKGGKRLATIDPDLGAVSFVRFHPDGKKIIAGFDKGRVLHFDKIAGEWKNVADLKTEAANKVFVELRDSPHVGYAHKEHGFYWVLDPVTGKTLADHANGHRKGSVSPNGRFAHFVVEGSRFNSVYRIYAMFDLLNNGGVWLNKPDNGRFETANFSPDGRTFAMGGKTLRVYESITYTERFSVTYDHTLASAVTYSPDGKALFVSTGGGLAIYDARRGTKLAESDLPKRKHGIHMFGFAPTGHVVTQHADGTFMVWSPDLWKGKIPSTRLEIIPEDLEIFYRILDQQGGPNVANAIANLIAAGDTAVAFLRSKEPPHETANKLIQSYRTPKRFVMAPGPKGWVFTDREGIVGGAAKRLRVIEILEHIGTPAAREALQHYAAGHEQAYFTVEAKMALENLRQSP